MTTTTTNNICPDCKVEWGLCKCLPDEGARLWLIHLETKPDGLLRAYIEEKRFRYVALCEDNDGTTFPGWVFRGSELGYKPEYVFKSRDAALANLREQLERRLC
jgi:hypothetical protein